MALSVVLKDLTLGYEGHPLRSGISVEIPKGECVLIAGANGAGKTTLLKTLSSRIKPLSGKVEISGEVSMVPSRVPKVEGFTVRQFIQTGLYSESSFFGLMDPSLKKRITDAMNLLGISHLEDKDISRISDGEFQKACIAAALVRKSDVIILDEPTSFLDVDSRISVLEALQKVSAETGKTVLFSSHDVLEAVKVCSLVLAFCKDGTTALSDRTMEKKYLLLQNCFDKLEL